MTSPADLARRRGAPLAKRTQHVSFADLGGLAVVLLGAYVLIGTPESSTSADASDPARHRILARGIQEIIGREIRGSIQVGSIDTVGRDGIVGRDVVFRDESGAVVLEAREVELEIDWGALARGRVVSPRGRARGGRIVLETLESGELLFDRAFTAADPGPPGAPIGPDVVRFERLAVSDVDVIVRIHGAPEMRAEHTSGIVLVSAPENGAARLRADRIDADVQLDSPIPQRLVVDDGHLALDGAARRRSRLRFPAHIGGEPVDLDIDIDADREENMHVSVTLVPRSVGAAFTSVPLMAQATILEAVVDEIDFTVDLP